MKNIQFKESKFKNFLSGKGFYIALAFCLVSIGVAAYTVFSSDMGAPNGSEDSLITMDASSNAAGGDGAYNVGNPQSDVPAPSSRVSSRPSSSKTSSKASSKANSGTSGQKLYVMPIGGEVLKAFSDDKPLYSQTFGDWRVHLGVDLKAEKGDPVKAVADGTVTEIKNDPMWGTMVTIDHGDGILAQYCNLGKETAVRKGNKVKIGAVIGSVGDTAPAEVAEPVHLHFAMQKDGKWVDPLKAMGKLGTNTTSSSRVSSVAVSKTPAASASSK